jgi:hypothetical protein
MVCDVILAPFRTLRASRRQGGTMDVLALKRTLNNLQQVDPLHSTGVKERD